MVVDFLQCVGIAALAFFTFLGISTVLHSNNLVKTKKKKYKAEPVPFRVPLEDVSEKNYGLVGACFGALNQLGLKPLLIPLEEAENLKGDREQYLRKCKTDTFSLTTKWYNEEARAMEVIPLKEQLRLFLRKALNFVGENPDFSLNYSLYYAVKEYEDRYEFILIKAEKPSK